MATITIQLPDEDAREIKGWAETHRRMLITSTVPALHNWDFNTASMNIQFSSEEEK